MFSLGRVVLRRFCLSKIRNIGVSAHIDSGKTTFSERVLFYAGKIDSIHEVKGSDEVGATMDFMELEREKGITIQSAATNLEWKGYRVNLIDTPGHVDFTIEVERALKVLDGAFLLVCGVGGVQPQTVTVNKQMNRYNVPRIIFINKLDRMGASPQTTIEAIRSKLGLVCSAIQVPIGMDERFEGLIDVIHKKAFYFQGRSGESIVEKPIPANLKAEVDKKRLELVEVLANIDKEIEEYYLEEKPLSAEILESKIRELVIKQKFYPVMMGSAYKNKGVQLALDAVLKYLPCPSEKENFGYRFNPAEKKEEQVRFTYDPLKKFVGYAFKLEENRYGQLTFVRVYEGKLVKGDILYNSRTGKKVKISRMVKMHANKMEDVQRVQAGDIFALFGVECSTGDTLTESSEQLRCASMFVPDAVMSFMCQPSKESTERFQKAISKFQKEDPTFRVSVDKESQEIIISGMGQLHLQIYAERMKREFSVDLKLGQPSVNLRETISRKARFDYLHKKQTGGAGQYARVIGYVEPISAPEDNNFSNQFVNKVQGNSIPPQFINAVEKAFYQCCEKGPLTGYPVINFRYVLEDGATHVVDSSANAFGFATKYSFTNAMNSAGAMLLEPIMNLEVTVDKKVYSSVMAGISKRRGNMTNTETKGEMYTLSADVPLRQMFGYAVELRGITSGEGQFSMQYKKHAEMSPVDAAAAIEKWKRKKY